MTDSIADMLIRIKNAQMAKHDVVSVSHSNMKFELARIFKKEGWISDFAKKGKKVRKSIDIVLKYDEDGQPKISNVKRISKSSHRFYIKANKIKAVRQGFGMAVISTPQGLMTDREARAKKVGGEVICEIY